MIRHRSIWLLATATATIASVQLSVQSEAQTAPALAARPSQSKEIISVETGRLVPEKLAPGGTRTFRLRLKSGQRVEIDAASPQIDTRMTLYDDRDREIASNTDGGRNRDARLHLQAPISRPPVHVFYVVVGTEGKDGGAFELLVREIPALTPPGPTPIARGQEINGLLTAASAILPGEGHSYAVHTFDGKAGDRIRIDLFSSEFDPEMELRHGGERIASDDDGGEGTASRLISRLEKDGPYEIWASARDKPVGRYRLSLAQLPEPLDAPRLDTIAVGQVVQNVIDDTDALIARFNNGGTTSHGRGPARLPDGCTLPSGDRAHRLFKLNGNAAQSVRIVLTRTPLGGKRCQILLEVGVNSPIGFAPVLRRALTPSALVTFEQAGEVLIRISTLSGITTDYSIKVSEEGANPVSATAATNGSRE